MADVRRTLFSDAFSSDGTLGEPNYTAFSGMSMAIASGGSAGLADRDSGGYYTGPVPSDQWVSMRHVDVPDSNYDSLTFGSGLVIRSNTSFSTGYVLFLGSDEYQIVELPDQTILHRIYRTAVEGDDWRLEVQGDTLKLFLDDAEVHSITGLNSAGGGVGFFSRKYTDSRPKEPSRVDDFMVGDWTVDSGFAVDHINSDNTIESGFDIYVSGQNLDTVTGATLKGYGDNALSIKSQSESQIVLNAVDLIALNYPYGGGTSIELTDGTQTTPIGVTVTIEPGYQYVVGASIDTTYGLAQAGGSNGDQWRVPVTLSPANVALRDDTNFILDTPVADGTTLNFMLYSGGVWDTGDAVIGQNSPTDVPAAWLGNIPIEPIIVGVEFAGSVAGHATGTAPLTFSEVLQEKPTDFVTRSDGSYSGFVPTADSFNMQYKVSNAANQIGDLSNLLIYNPTMPTISGAKHQNVTTTGAQITMTTPSKVGTVYWIADPDPTEPTPEQIVAGENALGQGAELAGAFVISSSGQQPWQNVTGGTPGVRYYYWMVQVN